MFQADNPEAGGDVLVARDLGRVMDSPNQVWRYQALFLRPRFLYEIVHPIQPHGCKMAVNLDAPILWNKCRVLVCSAGIGPVRSRLGSLS